jgi:putative surface protein (fragment)
LLFYINLSLGGTMENKSNSNKVNRQQREKVLRFSIRKYSFGAASVAVAALMFLSGHQAVRVEAAQVSDTTEAPVIPDKEEAHTATIVDLPKTEDSLTTGKEEKITNHC